MVQGRLLLQVDCIHSFWETNRRASDAMFMVLRDCRGGRLRSRGRKSQVGLIHPKQTYRDSRISRVPQCFCQHHSGNRLRREENFVRVSDRELESNFNCWTLWTGPMPNFLNSSLKTACLLRAKQTIPSTEWERT